MTIKDLDRVKKAVIRKYPLSCGIVFDGLEIELTKSIETAAVVGERNSKGVVEVKIIKVNPEFFDKLTFSERVFVLAHEAMHIAMKHFSRAIDKPDKDIKRKYDEYCQKEPNEEKRKIMYAKLHKKYQNIWNIATDACINASLREDGLTFPENVVDPKTGQKMKFVDLEEGFTKCAEKIYDFLVKKDEEKEEKRSQNNQNGNNSNSNENNGEPKDGDGKSKSEEKQESESSSSSSQNIEDIDAEDYDGFDSHEEWTGSEEKDMEKSSSSQENEDEIDEEEIFKQEKENRKKQEKQDVKDALKKVREGKGLDKFVPVAPVVSWKRLLVGTLEKTEEVWGTRRASRYNPNARIEERTFEKLPSVEVVLDTSGSISDNLLKGFLLQLCPLFEQLYGEVSIKVGCFADDFYGFTEISSKEDIIKYHPYRGNGTDFEKAATAFSPDPGCLTTKIVFTDGGGGNPQKTKNNSIIWIVFGNYKNFKPLGGRVIRISDEEYKKMEGLSLKSIIEESKGLSL